MGRVAPGVIDLFVVRFGVRVLLGALYPLLSVMKISTSGGLMGSYLVQYRITLSSLKGDMKDHTRLKLFYPDTQK